MPTPVCTARQCLTEEASHALDDAVAVARRRSHAQTTSLHAVSALLALPSSPLREACTRARSSAYSPRLQFRALELSVSVSLDRLPSSKAVEEPPVSNSLMAAIKRSQAIQRRHPDSFQMYQQLQSSISSVKVELKHFILSILDDPIVSRVFGEAGFRSCDIKLAVLNPPTISRFSRAQFPPLFLCNLPSSSNESSPHSFNFPFASFSGSESGNENCRRIGEVLVKKNCKNPLLIGVCASDALSCFKECVRRNKVGVLPSEINGLSLICIEGEISEYFGKSRNKEMMRLKFDEVGDMVKRCTGSGIVLNYGELKVFLDENSDAEALTYVVSQLSSLVAIFDKKLWLIGVAGSYETYMKFLGRFPSIDKEWDLHLLPITSAQSAVGGLYSKSSLMGSFVPFGGFFPTPSEFEQISISTNQNMPRCALCNGKYEQELSVLKRGVRTSVAHQHTADLSPWLQSAECKATKPVDAREAKDDEMVLNARIMGLQRKWDDICQRLHKSFSFQRNTSQDSTQVQEGYNFVAEGMKNSNDSLDLNENRFTSMSSCVPIDMKIMSLPAQSTPIPVTSDAVNPKIQYKLPMELAEVQQPQADRSLLPISSLHNVNHPPDNSSSTSVTFANTDLGLGTHYTFRGKEPSKCKFEYHKDRMLFLGSVPAEFDKNGKNASNGISQSSSCSGFELGEQSSAKDFKGIWRFLAEKVSWQDEAIYTISQTVSLRRGGHGRNYGSHNKGDIWLSFLGPDKVGKTKIAAALAEIIFGSKDSLVRVDLSSKDGVSHLNTIVDYQDVKNHNNKLRGKTVVDYISEQLRKKPLSVFLIENIDEADFLTQNSLSQAIRTGRFPDTHGREISINNMIFVTTSSAVKFCKNYAEKEPCEFSEERILGAKGSQLEISVEHYARDAAPTQGLTVSYLQKERTSKTAWNKRKFMDSNDLTEKDKTLESPNQLPKLARSCLDLNLPVEEMEEIDYQTCDKDSGAEATEAWLGNFLDEVDANVIFKPIDFDALADKVLKEIGLCYQKTIKSGALLEIDQEVMAQILAAAWLSGKQIVDDWVEQVLQKSFMEVQQSHHLTAQSVVKLVACKGLLTEEQAFGCRLPVRIFLN